MGKYTKGPWQWFGDAKYGGFYLATPDRGRQFVMRFTRMGMQSAQPMFQVNGFMKDARDLCKFEVGNRDITGYDQAKKDPSVYRYDVIDIDHPDAHLIAAAPDLLEALQAIVALTDRNTIEFDRAKAAIAKALGEAPHV